MLKITKSRFYLIPVVMRTLDIVELVSRSGAPLKMNEISRASGVSQTTTYRILRTLVHRGYLAQDIDGRFGMWNRSKMNVLPSAIKDMEGGGATGEQKTELSGEQVIEILNGVLQKLRKPNEDVIDREDAYRNSQPAMSSDVH